MRMGTRAKNPISPTPLVGRTIYRGLAQERESYEDLTLARRRWGLYRLPGTARKGTEYDRQTRRLEEGRAWSRSVGSPWKRRPQFPDLHSTPLWQTALSRPCLHAIPRLPDFSRSRPAGGAETCVASLVWASRNVRTKGTIQGRVRRHCQSGWPLT